MPTEEQRLRLTIELVPSPLWNVNLRTAIGQTAWKKLSKSIRDGYEGCGLCDTPRAQLKRLNCHEIWLHDDERHIQNLQGFIALCDWCHHIKHIGLAGTLARQGQLDFERLIQHFLTVNQCTR